MHRFHLMLSVALLAAGAASAQTPNYHVADRIPLSDGGWDYASVDPSMHRVYLARPDAVTAVDLDTGKVSAKLVAAARGHAALPLKSGAEVLVTNGTPGSASFIDARTGAVLDSVKTGAGADAAIYDTNSKLVIVANHAAGTVTLIDPDKRKAVGEIKVGGTLEFAAVDKAGNLFVNDEDGSTMSRIDIKTKKVTKTIKLPGCEGPTGLAYLAASNRLMASCANSVVAIVDPKAGKLEKTLPTGEGSDAVIYDHARKLAFVPAGKSGDLTIFWDDAKGVKPMGKIATQAGARTGAVDEKTGKVYLAAADYLPAAGRERPQIKPGSVVLLQVDP